MNEKIKISDLFERAPDMIHPLFAECRFPWEVLDKLRVFLECVISSRPEGFLEYSPGVLIGEGVEIEEGAKILPPTVISKNAKIRKDAYVRGSVFIGEGAVVGHATEVKNSVMMDHAEAPHFNYVGDSILGKRAHIGAGVILSNLKSDKTAVVIHADRDYHTGRRKLGAILGDHAEIGCNSVLNPGSIIGKAATVYPLTSFRGVLPEGYIAKSQGIIVKKDK